MRCPKCHYISFGTVTRCRNCGYEFSLAPEVQPLDLPIQTGDAPIGPLRDVSFDPQSPVGSNRSSSGSDPDRSGAAAPRLDLPLFTDRDPLDDAPLISATAAPRQPLAVRRPAPPPSPPKPRFEKSAVAPMLEIHDDEEPAIGEYDSRDAARRDHPRRDRHAARSVAAEPAAASEEFAVAPSWRRLVAGVIDVLIIVGIDAGVVVSTLRVLGLEIAQVNLLPPAPIALFLVLLNGGYLATFTAAGGQTIGKMLAGIRVIAQRHEDAGPFVPYTTRVSLGAAVLRATGYLASLLPAGLGFAAILLDKDGRALHDRLAETRVVRA
jgi:uncharacterized RDD family membrane protein YckC